MFRELLRRRSGVSEEQASVLEKHYELLRRWNEVVNLTAIDSVEGAVERHYCEALLLAARLPAEVKSVADIGSGAGFPGYPVAVVRPECSVALIEADQRKAVFLREASRGMPNVRVLARRAEDVSESFEWVISRAVSYAELSKGGWKLGGRLALLTGAECPPEKWGLTWDAVAIAGSRQRFLRISRARST